MYFFLSYAHGDTRHDELVVRFFEELCSEIRQQTGDGVEAVVGFMDHGNLRAGDNWPGELAAALSAAQTFIALCEPRFLRSDYCGKECTVFTRRLADYLSATGKRAPALIPILWIPGIELPTWLADLQHSDRRFGPAYARAALRNLIRHGSRQEYETFVEALAGRILEVAAEHRLPPPAELGDFHEIPSAFTHGISSAFTREIATPAAGPRPRAGPPPRPILRLEPFDSHIDSADS